MKVTVPKGEYVVAVSGGVDSMVLLDLLRKNKNLDLTVAHFNHGIRNDSSEDENLIRAYCQKHSIAFATTEGKLGKNTSEAVARKARYVFLRKVQKKTKSTAIITAHHKDDLLETAIINIIRGTSRRGLSSLKSTPNIIRPLLNFSKKDITAYAKNNHVPWREDSTNEDEKYLRNYVRKNISPNLKESSLNDVINKQNRLNELIKPILKQTTAHIKDGKDKIIRTKFINLPNDISNEVIRELLEEFARDSINKKTINKIVHFIKTAKNNSSLDINKSLKLVSSKDSVQFVTRNF
jgi:tRNA(Ile)-lysidine synthase